MEELHVKTPWVIQIEATQAALTAALGFLNRVTHWQEGKPDMHDIKVMLKEALK